MSFTCQYCEKLLNSISSLNHHQRTAKYCLKIRNEKCKFFCEGCKKEYSSKENLIKHQNNCVKYNVDKIITEKNKIIEELQEQNTKLQEHIKEISILSIQEKNHKITQFINKYSKKQPRQQFEERNVVYILTTPSLKENRRYILGKAKNLTNRLSTYNKTDEHEVIFYQECNDEETMSTLENVVFKKLTEYREQANRERFILPKEKDIEYFIQIIKDCLDFLK